MTPLSLTPQRTHATPRELTVGMLYHTFLDRSQRLQSDVAAQLNMQMNHGTDQRQRGSDWTWKLNRVATDKRRLSAQEYAAIAEALDLSRVEYLTLLRAADIPPTPDETTAALRPLRPFMEDCPWPVHCLSYRLDFIAWNAVTARVYGVGPAAAGPDLPPTLPTGEARVSAALQGKLHVLAFLFDPQAPLRRHLEETGPDEWEYFVRRELDVLLSYWTPLTTWGEPSWMTALLRAAVHLPDFKELWRQALAERMTSKLAYGDTSDEVIAGRVPTLRLGKLNVVLESHVLHTDPRLELVIHVPTDRESAHRLLRADRLSDTLGSLTPEAGS